MPDEITAEATGGQTGIALPDAGGASPAPQNGALPAESSNGQPPPGPVPYERFREVNERAKAAESLQQELDRYRSQYGSFEPWLPFAQELQEQGIRPEDAIAYLQQQQEAPQPQTDPETEFERYLGEQGLSVTDFLDAPIATQVALRRQHAVEARLEAQEQQQQQEQARAFRANIEHQFGAIAARPEFSFLQNPILGAVTRDAFVQMHQQTRGQATMEQVAAGIKEAIDGVVKANLAQYAAGKQADAQVPPVSGGSAPPPIERLNFHDLPESQRREMIAGYLRATQPG